MELTDFYRTHNQCRKCTIANNRKTFYRGQIPCDVVFVGEAPGAMEHLASEPFVGPPGTLLDTIICLSQEHVHYTFAITNTIACTPFSDNGIRQPRQSEMDNCWDRISDFISMCRPKAIVSVGAVAGDWLESDVQILHPAFILRQPEHKRAVMILEQVSKIVNCLEAQGADGESGDSPLRA